MPITAFVYNKKNLSSAKKGAFDTMADDTPVSPVGLFGAIGQRKRFRIKEGSIIPKSVTITVLEPRHGIFKGEVLSKHTKRRLSTKERKCCSS